MKKSEQSVKEPVGHHILIVEVPEGEEREKGQKDYLRK